jgi:hypothetical protein
VYRIRSRCGLLWTWRCAFGFHVNRKCLRLWSLGYHSGHSGSCTPTFWRNMSSYSGRPEYHKLVTAVKISNLIWECHGQVNNYQRSRKNL